MIVRIVGEGQFRMADEHLDRLNDLDNAVVDAVAKGDADPYKKVFGELLDFVRGNGSPLPDEELVGSDAIIPPDDTTLEEAREEFKGEGLIPG